jgi:adenine-specific DNA-methyltransferase
MSLDFMHLYGQRHDVFADTEVLQENVVMKTRRAPQSTSITLSTSLGATEPRTTRTVPATEVLRPDDPHAFVRLPMNEWDTLVVETVANLPASLANLGLAVSTGRVVDFRTRPNLRQDPGSGTVPLIYPGHFQHGRIAWPSPGSKKPNALHHDDSTSALMLPNETYVLVKRFSAKEERRRVVAAVSGPPEIPGPHVAFENHLNVFHREQHGLPEALACGLAGFLNSTLIDDYVRTFSGHTQINATDLRQLRYPTVEELVRLGEALDATSPQDQAAHDAIVADHVRAFSEAAGPVPVAA